MTIVTFIYGVQLIEVSGLTKVFEKSLVKAVDSISFKLEKGKIGCLIGTSGCGKTTTLRMINRLIEPTNGKVIVENKHSSNVEAIEWRRQIGYIIQKSGLLPHLNVKENISLLSKVLGKNKNEIEDRVRELMEIIHMPFDEFAFRYPHELSGGQQQRVGIARALMEDPSVILMDEPFGALDPITRSTLHDEFLLLNKKLHKTILMVTHDVDEAFKLADKVILMDRGRVIQAGSRDDFKNRPENQFVEDFVKGSHYA